MCTNSRARKGDSAVGKADPMVNVRMQPRQISEIEHAAARDDLSRSTWCREVITAACRSGLTLEALTERLATTPDTRPPIDDRRRLGASRVHTGDCLHPVHLVRRYPTRDVCACGTTVSRHDRRR